MTLDLATSLTSLARPELSSGTMSGGTFTVYQSYGTLADMRNWIKALKYVAGSAKAGVNTVLTAAKSSRMRAALNLGPKKKTTPPSNV